MRCQTDIPRGLYGIRTIGFEDYLETRRWRTVEWHMAPQTNIGLDLRHGSTPTSFLISSTILLNIEFNGYYSTTGTFANG